MSTHNTITNGKPALRSASPAEIDTTGAESGGLNRHGARNAFKLPPATTVPITLKHKLCRLDNLMGEVLNEVSGCNLNRPIRFHHIISGCDPHCEVDPVRMHKALRYLVENSLKSCPHVLKIRLRFFDTEIGGIPSLEIIYRDNAASPAEKWHSRRLARTKNVHRGGSSFGLTVVRCIVEAHGGQFVARDSDAEGVEFVIRLPRCSGNFAC